MRAVTFGRIDKIQAGRRSLVQNRVHLRLLELVSPFPSELPRANPDYRDLETGAAQRSIAHLTMLANRGGSVAGIST